MKLANDPRVDYKDLVRISYNQCARAYNEARHNQEPALLELIANKLPPYSEILDIGCGTGVPITKALAAQHKVVGVDFSEEQIKLARANVPEADFICRDITESEFPPASFDGIVAFYTLFHLPREGQKDVISGIGKWLKPCGYLLATLSDSTLEPYIEEDFFGTTMYWNELPIEEYKGLIERAGLHILLTGILGHGYQSDEGHKPEKHPYVLARKSLCA